jgi:uncharacterized protein (TIGR03067 family)
MTTMQTIFTEARMQPSEPRSVRGTMLCWPVSATIPRKEHIMSVTRTERVPTRPGWLPRPPWEGPPLPGRRAVLLLAATLCLWAAPPGRADDKDELAKLAGEWVVIAENEEGKSKDVKGVKAMHLTFTFGKDGKLKFTSGSDPKKPTTASGTFKINATKKPREIDLSIRTPDKKEHKILAIYELGKDKLGKDTLRIAMSINLADAKPSDPKGAKPSDPKGAKRAANFDGGANIDVYECRRK